MAQNSAERVLSFANTPVLWMLPMYLAVILFIYYFIRKRSSFDFPPAAFVMPHALLAREPPPQRGHRDADGRRHDLADGRGSGIARTFSCTGLVVADEIGVTCGPLDEGSSSSVP